MNERALTPNPPRPPAPSPDNSRKKSNSILISKTENLDEFDQPTIFLLRPFSNIKHRLTEWWSINVNDIKASRYEKDPKYVFCYRFIGPPVKNGVIVSGADHTTVPDDRIASSNASMLPSNSNSSYGGPLQPIENSNTELLPPPAMSSDILGNVSSNDSNLLLPMMPPNSRIFKTNEHSISISFNQFVSLYGFTLFCSTTHRLRFDYTVRQGEMGGVDTDTIIKGKILICGSGTLPIRRDHTVPFNVLFTQSDKVTSTSNMKIGQRKQKNQVCGVDLKINTFYTICVVLKPCVDGTSSLFKKKKRNKEYQVDCIGTGAGTNGQKQIKLKNSDDLIMKVKTSKLYTDSTTVEFGQIPSFIIQQRSIMSKQIKSLRSLKLD